MVVMRLLEGRVWVKWWNGVTVLVKEDNVLAECEFYGSNPKDVDCFCVFFFERIMFLRVF